MKKIIPALLFALMPAIISCNDNHATEPVTAVPKKTNEESAPPAKTDGPALAMIETPTYVMKLHRVFTYEPQGDEILAGMTPNEGFKFIYLDMSLKNISQQKIDGGFHFIALKVLDQNGKEYKKPSAALASFITENPGAQNADEYNALWEKFEPGEFHREIIFAVEVPEQAKEFTISMPVEVGKKERTSINFSL